MKKRARLIIILGISFIFFLPLISAIPSLTFNDPTPENNLITTNSSVEINLSITEPNLDELIYNWNGTNYTLFNDSLTLMYNFDNISALGENSTHYFDITGNGNNGTSENGATINESGKYGSAIEFSSENAAIDIPDLTFAGEFAIAFWWNVNYDSTNAMALSRGVGGAENKIGHSSDDSNFYVRILSGGTVDSSSASLPTENEWHFITITRDSSNKIDLYVDANSPTRLFSDAAQSGNSVWGMIGNAPTNSPPQDIDGLMDEIQFWNRSLSMGEIYQIYTSNLKRINSSNFNLYVNQSKNATDGLDTGDYTYFVSASNSSESENITETRTITIASPLSSCGTISTSGTYLLNQSVNSSGTCFTINEDEITIDGSGFTINYSQLERGNAVNNSANFTNLTVKNFNIVHPGNTSAHAIDSGGNYTFLQNNTITSNLSYPIRIIGGDHSIISGNNLSSSEAHTLQIWADNVSIINNTLLMSIGSGSEAALWSASSDGEITNNTITSLNTNTSAGAITFANTGNNNLIANNTINSTLSNAFYFSDERNDDYNLTGNIIIDNENTELKIISGADNQKIVDQDIRGYSLTSSGSKILVENTTYGKIDFTSAINGEGTNLVGNSASDIVFGNNSVFVNTSSNSGLNKSANVTLYNIGDRGFSNPEILKNGEICEDCHNFTSLTADTIIFNVSSWGTYSIGDNSSSESSSSSGSSSSSSSGSGGYPLFNPSETQVNEGYTKIIRENWRIQFTINNETHILKVENLLKDKVEISVSSERQEATILLGGEKKFELTNDDYYDLLVKVNSINSNQSSLSSNITIQRINEEISPNSPEDKLSFSNDIGETLRENNLVIIFLIVLSILGLIGFYCYKRLFL